jgi:NTP pyrophosphatase (non-canonical NTP hydrolase)
MMNRIIEENYESTILRGCIDKNTTKLQFLMKVKEEVLELEEALYSGDECNLKEEMADVILTVLNFAKHFDINIKQELKNKIKKNYSRSETA